MEAGPIWPSLAAFSAFWKVKQRQVHDAVGQRYGIADWSFDLSDALKVKTVLIELRRLLQVGHLDGNVSELGHQASPLNAIDAAV